MNTQTGGQVTNAERGRTGAKLVRPLAALALVNILLLAPGWVQVGRIEGPWLALEAGILAGVFALLPRNRWSVSAAIFTAIALVSVTIIAFGDTATRISLARPLNLYVDV